MTAMTRLSFPKGIHLTAAFEPKKKKGKQISLEYKCYVMNTEMRIKSDVELGITV